MSMTKAYWIAQVDVTDPAAYGVYRRVIEDILERHGARFLVRGGQQFVREGTMRARQVVIEFPDIQTARAVYDSAEYQSAIALRLPASHVDLCIVEGWAGD